MTEKLKCGYFEDRRPSSDTDPYVVTSKIVTTCVLPDFPAGEEKKDYFRGE
jgi:glutamine synthetase